MSLLKNYTRATVAPTPEYAAQPLTLIVMLNIEERNLLEELDSIAEAKKLEPELLKRLDVVQKSLKEFIALEKPEPEQLPEPVVRTVRKATPKKSTKSNIAVEAEVSDTFVAHPDFAQFPTE
jgi:hypothetical protein